jgi:cytochrome c oxidase subunit II
MKRSRRSLFLLISLIAILSIVLTACGGDDEDDPADEAPVATATTATETEATATTADEEDATTPPEDEGSAGDGDPQAGQAIAAQCIACHTTDGADGIGPTWQGLWMSEVTLEDGSTVTADEVYITESIREPNAKVHEGFQPVMPAFPLTDEQVADVIAYIQTLE